VEQKMQLNLLALQYLQEFQFHLELVLVLFLLVEEVLFQLEVEELLFLLEEVWIVMEVEVVFLILVHYQKVLVVLFQLGVEEFLFLLEVVWVDLFQLGVVFHYIHLEWNQLLKNFDFLKVCFLVVVEVVFLDLWILLKWLIYHEEVVLEVVLTWL